ncbi:hypothetical protein LINPERPRIM_LOCUS36243, partial [Linum perenne]
GSAPANNQRQIHFFKFRISRGGVGSSSRNLDSAIISSLDQRYRWLLPPSTSVATSSGTHRYSSLHLLASIAEFFQAFLTICRDHGLWQSTESIPPEILKLYITQEGMRSPFSSKVWEKSGYNTVERVRYITKARSYEFIHPSP